MKQKGLSLIYKKGFTLIEILVAFSIIAILSSVSIASFVTYGRSQVLANAELDVSTLLNKAKSRSQTQVKPDILDCQTNPLDGYKVVFLTDPSTGFLTGTYEMRVVCAGKENVIESKILPQGVTFSSYPSPTTTKEVFFKVISGGVDGSGTISLTQPASGNSKKITIDQTGIITVN